MSTKSAQLVIICAVYQNLNKSDRQKFDLPKKAAITTLKTQISTICSFVSANSPNLCIDTPEKM